MKCEFCKGTGKIQGQAPELITKCPACGGTGYIKKCNGDKVREMTNRELEILFDNVEYYAKKCEESNWYKCDTCDCPWCDREGDVDFGKWLDAPCK